MSMTACHACASTLPAGAGFCVSCGVAAPKAPPPPRPFTVASPAAKGVTLMPGEVVRHSTQLHPHLLLRHLDVTVAVTDQRVIVRSPHTIFGIIAHGYIERASGLGSVAEVSAIDSWSTRRLVGGCGLLLLTLLELGGLHVGGAGALGVLVFVPVAIWLLLTAHTMGVFVRNVGGGVLSGLARGPELRLVEDICQNINVAATERAALDGR